MKLFRNLTLASLMLGLCFAMVGCDDDSQAVVNDAVDAVGEKVENVATLFISVGNEFKEIEIEYDGELTAETLIQGISDVTGWDLTLSDVVTSGAGGMSVTFDDLSALSTLMPPDEQVEEFFVYDGYGLAESILNSVTETLQNNFVDSELGDPDLLDVYFSINDEDIEVYDVEIPMDEPWSGAITAE